MTLGCANWERGDMTKVKLFLLTFSICTISDIFTPTVCWNFSVGFLDFLPQKLSHLWVIVQISVLWGYWTTGKKSRSQFTDHFRVHSQDQDLLALTQGVVG